MHRLPFRLASLLFVLCLFSALLPLARAADAPPIRLYTFDGGRITLKDMGIFADTGEYDGKSGKLSAPAFLIVHPKGTLLWDTGLPEKIAQQPEGTAIEGGIHLRVDKTLSQQLKEIDMDASKVNFMAFSHMHFDHTGNANLFPAATWIVNRAELAWAQGQPAPFGVDPSTFTAIQNAKTHLIDGDHDVFGDGTVRILKAPGHTPGHQVLAIKLKKAGMIVLSGDLYHSRANRKAHRVPAFNHGRADTLASFDRIEKIVKNNRARFVVQHDPADAGALPQAPGFLE
jgi:N-acyl homoserine lactone hydrolase